MKPHTTGRGLALIAGFLATSGALAILLQDALASHVWTLQHGLIPVLMAVQILTSHLFITALLTRRWLSAIGFLVVAIAGTWGVFYTSVGKQSEVAAEKTAIADDINGRRADVLTRLAANEDMLKTARISLAGECGTGKGSRCTGKRETVKVYEDAVRGNQADLAMIGPEKPVNAQADTMAELVSVVTGADQGKVKHVLVLTQPFTYATIFELAALVSWGFAFGHGRRVGARMLPTDEPSERDVRQTSFPNGSGGLRVPNRSTPKAPNGSRKDAILAALLTDQAMGKRFGSQREVAERFDVPASTLSEWLGVWEDEGLLPKRIMHGRCKSFA